MQMIDRRYTALCQRGLSLDMTRGKPCPEQLDLANALLAAVGPLDHCAADGTDCRNYGGLDGLPEAKALFAAYLEVSPNEVLLGNNSSLALMHDALAYALRHGVPGSERPWSAAPIRFLCPAPGFDRHFAICEHLDIDMIAVEQTAQGPNMDQVEALAARDASIKGIWVVPKYANPTGVTCSDRVVERLARMHTAAPDFRVLWDNAYAHHDLVEPGDTLANLLERCKAADHAERAWLFGSTSKVSFAGGGIGLMAGSERNMTWMRTHRAVTTIGSDKLNELRHVRFFRDLDGVRRHMREHAAILQPKFELVDRVLTRELAGKGVATWTRPRGGYFVSLDTLDGCAHEVVSLAARAGVKLTPAGSTFPHGKDPRDRNIRIAPTWPTLPEIEAAMEVLSVCIQRVALPKLGGR